MKVHHAQRMSAGMARIEAICAEARMALAARMEMLMTRAYDATGWLVRGWVSHG